MELMEWFREDVHCPACTGPGPAFTIEDVGMKISVDEQPATSDYRFTARRPLWEPLMLAHIADQDDDAHRKLHAQCMAVLSAAQVPARGIGVRQAQDALRLSLDDLSAKVNAKLRDQDKAAGQARRLFR